MTDTLDGQISLITGAAGGIGAACARALAKRGATVAIHYNSRHAEAEQLAQEIAGAGGTAMITGGDLTDPAIAARVVQDVVDAYGSIDVLVNNSGAMVHAPLADLTPEILLAQFQINAFSVFYMIRAAAPHFPQEGGAIVNITTNLTHNAIPGVVAYSAAKAAVENLTMGFFKELATRRITVNAVAPGATRTAMTAGMSAAQHDHVIAATPFGRLGEPEDIAEVVAFLASPAGRWTTGQSIMVDGGLTMGAFGR
ncbi:SDR family oxidoreductase [soil metagenome]